MEKTKLFPNGGFLPIYVCDEKIKRLNDKKKEQDELNKKQYKTPTSVVSIKQIMEQRKNNDPFIKF